MFSFGSERKKKTHKKSKILAASQSPGNTPPCPATNRAMIILAPAQVWALTSLNGRKVKPTCQKGHLEECSRCTEPAGSSSAPGKNKQFMNCANTRVLEKYTRWRVFYEAITAFVSKWQSRTHDHMEQFDTKTLHHVLWLSSYISVSPKFFFLEPGRIFYI